jgi:hypothetical protein
VRLFFFGYTTEQLKGRSFAEGKELLSVLSELMSEIPPDMILPTGIEGYFFVLERAIALRANDWIVRTIEK